MVSCSSQLHSIRISNFARNNSPPSRKNKLDLMDKAKQVVLLAIIGFVIFIISAILIIVVILSSKKEPGRQHHARTRTRDNIKTFDSAIRRISMAELVQATQNFSPDLIIGGGSFGLVYKGNLSNGITVAVKKIGPAAFQGFGEFRAEMETLGKIRHPNMVKLLGYCDTGPHRVLIYEFVGNGRLDQWLYNYDLSSPLSWETRISIMKGVAKGLCYIHNLNQPIIHRDIKASNVLLDSNFEAHIADFGLARNIEGSHTHVSTDVAGTSGYIPPEYQEGRRYARVSGDIYSFGMLMLEITSATPPNLPILDHGQEIGFLQWARKMVDNNREMEMVDAKILSDLKEEGVIEFLRIATLCISTNPRDRPTMNEVVKLLDGILL